MGLNISLYKVADVQEHKFESDNRFDYIRYGGDREFAAWFAYQCERIFCNRPFCCDWSFSRPKDFEQTRQWIRENIVEDNQKRLLDVVTLMEQEPDLWLYFGY